jgi:Putative regulator of cell autolysis
MEYMNWIISSIFTVYALNIGVILQFIFLSVGITESIKDSEREKQRTQLELLSATEKNKSMRLIELKKQMNPHFIFNALNSILERILTDKKEQAVDFLMRFSKLIRSTLNYSEQIFIPLSEEIIFIENYLLLEQMRLGNTFFYTIDIEENIPTDEIEFPSFILQPFIENAIWHGLMPKNGNKIIRLDIRHQDNILHVQIIDNGIGRDAASKLKEKEKHASKGISIVRERLALIQLTYQLKTDLTITDLYDDHNQPNGTIIHIQIETSDE